VLKSVLYNIWSLFGLPLILLPLYQSDVFKFILYTLWLLVVDERDAVLVDNVNSTLPALQEVTTVDGPKVEVNNWIAAIYNDKWYPGVLNDN